MKVQIQDQAQRDLFDGYWFYERQSPGVGRRFLDSLFSDIDSLEVNAGVHVVRLGYHRLLARRFPFAIYYRVEDSRVRVYAVLDCRRDPAWIRDRLT